MLGRFLRAALTGGVTFGVDLAALYLLLHLGWSARAANVPALLLALALSFLLQRVWVFRAVTGDGRSQLGRFLIVEASALAIGGVLFHVLAPRFGVSAGSTLVLRAAIGQITFLGWSFPLGHWVFPARERGNRDARGESLR